MGEAIAFLDVPVFFHSCESGPGVRLRTLEWVCAEWIDTLSDR